MINQKQCGYVRLGKQAKDLGSYYINKNLGETSLKFYVVEKGGITLNKTLLSDKPLKTRHIKKICTAACSRHILHFTFELSLHNQKHRSRNTYTKVNKEPNKRTPLSL